jgi:hypothetical protein
MKIWNKANDQDRAVIAVLVILMVFLFGVLLRAVMISIGRPGQTCGVIEDLTPPTNRIPPHQR